MRTKRSIMNIICALFQNILSILIGFIVQKIFINSFGTEYLGLNGLLGNIISMLCVTELGLGSAIIYNLYKPIEKKDKKTIRTLMNLYKRAYQVIALCVLIIGIMIMPFIDDLVGKTSIKDNISMIYLLFLFEVVISYLTSYKRSLLEADQKNFIINLVHVFYLIIYNTLSILLILFIKNYYIYIGLRIISKLIENTVLNIIVNKKYSYINEKTNDKLKKEIKQDIIKRLKAIAFHKLGGFIVFGTDNILITKMFGIISTGLLSNYNMIIVAVQNLSNQIIQPITASVGNLLVAEKREKHFEVYKKIRLINVWVSIYCATSILVVMESFINLWIGKEYLLSYSVLLILVINYYMNSTRNVFNVFKDAAGICYEDRFIPLLESAVNLIFSIVFGLLFGLTGIFLGTLLSHLILHLYSYPKYVYTKLFNKNKKDYFKEFFVYLFIFLISLLITSTIAKLFVFDNGLMNVFKNIIISLIIPNVIMIVCFYNTDEFKFILYILEKFKNKLTGGKEYV